MIGKTVSHYSILEKLGGGGMGVVYKAEDTRLKRFVALKFLPPELTHDEAARERFEQEARAASALDHSNVCTIHEIDETEDGQVFICMAYYEGETLKGRLARGPVGIDETINIALQVAEGLRQAHEHAIVHRDIKPANVIVTRDGAAKIVDFGLATLTGKPHAFTATEIAGTLSYMSPEQVDGSPLDQRTDLWSLGVTMYEMLTGRLPFTGGEAQSIMQAIAHQDPPPIESLRTGAPPQLAAVVARCLRKDREERYQSAADLRADLRRVKHALTSATVSSMQALSAPPSSRRRIRVRTLLPVVAAVVAVALIAAVPPLRRTVQRWLAVPLVPDQLHVAVLGFTNIGGDPANRAFCDGVTEILASALTRIENFRDKLWVVPASEVRARQVKSPSEARSVFGVNLAVTGSVARAGDRVHLTVNLVDAESLRQVSSEVIEAREADLPVLEDRVASTALEMMKVRLEPAEREEIGSAGSKVPQAYELYVRARGTLESYEGESDPAGAADLFRQAIALDPGYGAAYAGLAQAELESYRKSRDARLVNDAAESARRALALDERLGDVHATLGLIDSTTGKYETAVREFKRAIEVQPRNAAAISGLGRAYEALGDAGQAEKTYRAAIALRPDFWVPYAELGAFYFKRSRYDEAERQFKKIVELTPANAWGYNNVGAVALMKGRKAEAREMFERSVAIKPLYGTLSNLGTLYFHEDRPLDAAKMYERALVMRRTDFRLWGNLGIAYFLANEKAKAKAAYERAVEVAEQQRKVNPRDTRLLIDLGGYYGMLGERAKGLAILEPILKAPPTDADSMAAIGQSLEDLGERDRAIEWFGRALKGGYPVASLEQSRALRGIRDDERFKRLIEENKAKL